MCGAVWLSTAVLNKRCADTCGHALLCAAALFRPAGDDTFFDAEEQLSGSLSGRLGSGALTTQTSMVSAASSPIGGACAAAEAACSLCAGCMG